MVIGIGFDLVDVARIRADLKQDGPGFTAQVFTPAEAAYCSSMRYPERHFAARFAAKEALFKALGTAPRDTGAWREVDVRREASGEVRLVLCGRTEELARARGAERIHVSLSHTAEFAAANVVLES